MSKILIDDKNIWREIYEATSAPYFVEVKLYNKAFLRHCRKHPNGLQEIPSEIKKNIKTAAV